jgi:mono/diheme cytochrome c family protein
MSRLVFTAIVAAELFGVMSAAAADEDSKLSIAAGKIVFERVCAPCHGKGAGTDGARMLPGSAALATRYQGKLSPYLEDRSDLTADALKVFIRRGIGAMPMFRKTEISDSEIEAVAAYLRAAK